MTPPPATAPWPGSPTNRWASSSSFALTVSLFALALWRFLCAAMGDPAEGSEPKDRVKYGVLGVVYLLRAVATLGVTVENWTGSSS